MTATAVIDELVAANRILYREGVVDGFGHVSVRREGRPDRFLLSCSRAPGIVTADDILEHDLDGNAAEARGRTLYAERFIHSEIYRRDPAVVSVVHSHSPSIIPFGVTKVALRPIFHLPSFLALGVPVFEIRDAGGPSTDLLIRDRRLGAALAERLGTAPVALLRGHGDVVTGRSLREAVFRAIYTEVNARLEAQALQLGGGDIEFLTEGEAAAATATNAGVIERAWDLWHRTALPR